MNEEIRFHDMGETPPVPGKNEYHRRAMLILTNAFQDVWVTTGKIKFKEGAIYQITDIYEMGSMYIEFPPVEGAWLRVLAWANMPALPKRYKYK